jgi:hypothetical protein
MFASMNAVFIIFVMLIVQDRLNSTIVFVDDQANWSTHEGFYSMSNQIELITADEIETVLDSNFLNIVKFYAHNDSYSGYVVPRYIKFANETQLWRSTIMRILAIDCANDNQITIRLCKANGAKSVFPQFKFYVPFQTSEIGHDFFDSRFNKFVMEKLTDEDFLRNSIRFIEQQSQKPDNWPILKAYR